MSLIVPVILCGGSGTRLWPLSRPARPKPFLPLLGETSLFEETLARCADPALFAPPLVVTGAGLRDLVASQARGAQVIVEPAAKNTAPAIALGARQLPEDALMLVCPSDHHIADVPAFHAAVRKAAGLAEQGLLVAFGIAPTRAETGYGYIERGERLGDGFRIARFIEKPPLADAERYVASGRHCWNGGIFLFRAGTYLEELAKFRPEMVAAVGDPAAFADIAGESVDFAVMEQTGRAAMVEVDMGWSDIGNWQSLRDAREGDANGNVVRGEAELLDCRKVMVESDGPRVSVVGLEDVIVVVDGDEVLVTSAAGAAKVGQLKGAKGG
jgi:mannose-1-phosphate guanylyltransferase/mannose-6-phosphate isomerase